MYLDRIPKQPAAIQYSILKADGTLHQDKGVVCKWNKRAEALKVLKDEYNVVPKSFSDWDYLPNVIFTPDE